MQAVLENVGIDTIDWPTGSPDLNPIEHLWDIMFRSIRRHQVALQTVQIWEEISQDTIRRLIRSIIVPDPTIPHFMMTSFWGYESGHPGDSDGVEFSRVTASGKKLFLSLLVREQRLL
ncbi:hypothetical protein NFI96_006775 [Prochilodus magdalenae]|nr:hypothetical protein NFI96_006775 [Prochilodus magdalenae]